MRRGTWWLKTAICLLAGWMAIASTNGVAAELAGGGVMIDGHEARPDRLIARFQPGPAETDKDVRKKLANLGVTLLPRTAGVPGLAALSLDPTAEGPAAAGQLLGKIKELRATGWFQYVEPDWIVRISALPTDSAFADGTLWGLRNTGQSAGTPGADIDAVAAWDITTGSTGVVVAVIDTGIRHTHQDLAANMWQNPGESGGGKETNGIDDDSNGYIDDVHGINSITGSGNPMDDNDHGSHCAGTIGATANGGGPHVGVAWNVRLMGVKFLSATGSGSTTDAIECINYSVAKGAKILSNSWGGGGYSQGLFDSIVAARNAGVLFVAAAGNESSNNDAIDNYPSNYDVSNVVAVAALDRNDQLAGFSNYGQNSVDLGAPGVAIYSCTAASDTSYDSFNGTSMATPHVSGAAALLAAALPAATPTELKQRLMNAARPVSAMVGRSVTGATLDAHASLTVFADGILELNASASSTPLPSGGTVNAFVTVTDLTPVTGATVDARFGTQPFVRLNDTGVSPDAFAGDGVYSASMTVPTVSGTVQMNVTASAPGKQPATADLPFAVAAPPPNDHFAARTLVAAGTAESTGSNANASSEPGEPRNPSVAGGKSVWWSWTASSTTSVTISTAGSSYDTTLAIYTGNTLGSLVLIGANDDSSSAQSSLTFNAIAGTVYAIQVDGYSSATGSITLNHPLTGAAPGAPDIVANPSNTSVLVGQPFSLQVSAQGNATLAYQWYRNDEIIPGANAATYGKPSASFGDEGDYHVLVTNAQGAAQSSKAYVAVEQTAILPENDSFASATVLTGATGRIRASNRLASGESGEPNHANASSPLASVWWKWTASADGTLALDTFGSAFDSTLAAYSGTSVAGLTELASNNDANGSTQSAVSIPVLAGQTYAIAIDGAGSAEGAIVFNYSFEPDFASVPNDLFANRTTLVPGSTSAAGSNIGATGETGEPDHATESSPLASAWWSWTAPGNGSVVIDTNGSDFDTTLAIYSGNAVASLTPLASNDDGGTGANSRVNLVVTSGQVIQIAVDGYGSDQGSIDLNLAFTGGSIAPPPNDSFAGSFLIPGGTTQVVGTNVNATGEAGEPVHDSQNAIPLNSVWWRWVAPISGTLTINLAGSISTEGFDMDTILAIYQGTAVDDLTLRASNDDEDYDGDIYTSKASLAVTAGQTYHIAVDSYSSEMGAIVMTLGLAGSGSPPSLAESLDNGNLVWTTGGSSDWSGVVLPSHDGVDSARSGTLSDSSESWLETTVTGPGTLGFWWKVDSEEGYDYLNLLIDNVEQDGITGLVDWEFKSVDIPAGSHTVRLAYAKDEDYQEGLDTAWVDSVTFTPNGFTGWMETYPAAPVNLRGPLDDPDDDSVTNLLEYFQNTSPIDPLARAGINRPVVTSPGQFTTSFRRNKNPAGTTGTVQWSPDLVTWGASGQTISGTQVSLLQSTNTSPVDHDNVTITGTVTNGSSARIYLRLMVAED